MHLPAQFMEIQKTFPLNEKDNINPKNIYGLSKKINEEMADVFSRQFNISFVGLRFFLFLVSGVDQICL